LYGFHISRTPGAGRIWLDRSKNKEARMAVGKTFNANKIKPVLKEADPALGSECVKLYELCIDEGGHPNLNKFLTHSLQKNSDKELILSLAYLNPDQIESCVGHVIETGNCIIGIYRLMYKDWMW